MLFFNQSKRIRADQENTLAECIEFVESALSRIGTDKRLLLKTLILAEESAAQIIKHSDEGAYISVKIKKLFGDAQITISAPGQDYDPFSRSDTSWDSVADMENEQASDAARAILLKAQGEKLKFSSKHGRNSVRIISGQSEKSQLIITFAALILGLLFGILMSAVFPKSVSSGLSTYVLVPIRTMFMNALKIIIAPVVFFSIVSCISQFKDITELGRIGAKTMGMYLFTTIIAVLLAFGVTMLFHPGTPGFALQLSGSIQEVKVDTNAGGSLLDAIVNIIPSNFLQPFLESNTLQLIFLAVLCGLAVGMIGEYSSVVQNLFDSLNSLFLTITAIITRFIPVAVFCSVALILVETGTNALLSVLSMVGTQLFTIFCMFCVYGVLVLIMGHLNPLTFFKKNREGMLTSFTLSSSSAAMPTNMKTCTEKLGISPKVSNFSIPLGATINMDGSCIFLMVSGLFLARAYNVNIPGEMITAMMVAVILLSLGAPGVPGSALVCLGIVLECLNVPMEAIGLVIGVTPFLDMFDTMSNTTGDVATALIVAKSEGLVDLKKYNS